MSREYAENNADTAELNDAIHRSIKVAERVEAPSMAALLSRLSFTAEFSRQCDDTIQNLTALGAERDLKLMDKDINTYNSLMSATRK